MHFRFSYTSLSINTNNQRAAGICAQFYFDNIWILIHFYNSFRF